MCVDGQYLLASRHLAAKTHNQHLCLGQCAGMTLANMSITLGIIPFVAHLADRGMPRLRAAAVILGVAAVVSVPMMLAISTQKLVAAWLCQVRVEQGRHTVVTWFRGVNGVVSAVHMCICNLAPCVFSSCSLHPSLCSALPVLPPKITPPQINRCWTCL